MALSHVSEFRIEKYRAPAVLTLSNGATTRGCFFVAGGSARHSGPEGVGDVLNADVGFLPFEVDEGGRTETVLVNRSHIAIVALAENEASREPAYNVATRRTVSLLLSNGARVTGVVRVYRPAGRDRLSDWAQYGERFRYIDLPEGTFIVNIDHVIDAREIES